MWAIHLTIFPLRKPYLFSIKKAVAVKWAIHLTIFSVAETLIFSVKTAVVVKWDGFLKRKFKFFNFIIKNLFHLTAMAFLIEEN